MKRIFLSVLLVALALGLMAFQPTGPAQDNPCSSVVMGGSCVLQSDETLQSDMLIMGGSAVLEKGSTVEGDVVVMGGNLDAQGTIEGDLNVIGGNATLGSHARVEGDVNTAGGNLDRREGAEIEGSYNQNVPFPFDLPGRMETPSWNNGAGSSWSDPIANGFNLVWKAFWWLARSLLWAVLALIVVLMVPRNVERVAAEGTARPVEAGGLGCLTAIVVPLILAVLAITICGIPVTIVGALLLLVAWSLGIIALGYELGKRLVHMLKQDWAPAVTAALGTAVLTLAMNGIGAVVPCIGWVVPLVVGMVGLGAVLLTRFGADNLPGGSILSGGPWKPAAPSSYGAYGTQVYDAPAGADAPSQAQAGDDIPPTVGIYDPVEPNDPSM